MNPSYVSSASPPSGGRRRVALGLIVLLPILSAVSAEVINSSDTTFPMLLTIAALSVVPVIITSTNLVPTKWLPLLIASVSVSLVLHQALISSHLWGSDIQIEYYYYNQVATLHHWSSTITPANQASQGYAATLSVTIFPAVLSQVSGIPGLWIFKIVFPLLFALVPVVLYLAYHDAFRPKPAFLAAYLFASIPAFYEVDLTLGKQMIAVLLLALFMLILTRKATPHSSPVLLLIGFGIIESHYSTGLYAVILTAMLVPFLWLSTRSKTFVIRLAAELALLYLAWYIFNTNGYVIGLFTGLFTYAASQLTSFFEPGSRYGLAILSQAYLSPVDQVIKIFNLTVQVLISIGVLAYILRNRIGDHWRVSETFAKLALLSFGLLVLSVLLPYLSAAFDVTRLYTLALIFLAPFGIVGGEVLLRWLGKVVRLGPNRSRPERHGTLWIRGIGLFLCVFLLLNTGVFSSLAHESYPSAFSVVTNSPYSVYTQAEFSGGVWSATHAVANTIFLMDPRSAPMFLSFSSASEFTIAFPEGNSSEANGAQLFYVGGWNLKNDMIQVLVPLAGISQAVAENLSANYGTYIHNSNQIYANGGSILVYPLRPQ